MKINNNRKDWALEKLGDFADYEKGKKPKDQSSKQSDIFKYPYINICNRVKIAAISKACLACHRTKAILCPMAGNNKNTKCHKATKAKIIASS